MLIRLHEVFYIGVLLTRTYMECRSLLHAVTRSIIHGLCFCVFFKTQVSRKGTFIIFVENNKCYISNHAHVCSSAFPE